ncbi:MAG: methyl-accepting chemotaxis protein [Lachnospiraceae bacterium]|nr:methyl-accepting chemotaxis protein [Lachnospiraceae bacterium]
MARNRISKGIHKQMLASFSLIVVLMIIVGVCSVMHIRRVYVNGNTIYEDNLMAIDYLKSISENVKEIDQYTTRIIKRIGKDTMAENKAVIEIIRAENDQIMDKYEALELTELEKRRYKQCRLSVISFNKYIDDMIKLAEQGNTVAASNMYEEELLPVEACTYELIDAATELASKRASQKNADNRSYYTRTTEIITIITIIVVILSIIVSNRIREIYSNKLKKVREWADGLAQYNLSNELTVTSDDEFGASAKKLNDAQFMIRELLSRVIDESISMSDIGTTIAKGAQKSKDRIEAINLMELQYEEDGEQLTSLIKKTMEQCPLDSQMIAEWNVVLKRLDENINLADESSKELMSIATYLDQIRIEAEHQNELIVNHKNELKKFRV